jgi:hypothetical protein
VKESEERNLRDLLYCPTNICTGAQPAEHTDAMVEILSEQLTTVLLEECLFNQLTLTELDTLTVTSALLPSLHQVPDSEHQAEPLGTGQAQLNLQMPTLLYTYFKDLYSWELMLMTGTYTTQI